MPVRKPMTAPAAARCQKPNLQVARGEPAAAGDHDEEEQAERDVDQPFGGRIKQGARAQRRRRACRPAHRRRTPRQSICFHHDVILAKFDIRATTAMIGIGLARTEGEHQDRQQDDGGAGADDAAHRAGDEADDEDECVGQHGLAGVSSCSCGPRASRPLMIMSGRDARGPQDDDPNSRCSAAATFPPARASSRGAWHSPRAGRGRCARRRNTAPAGWAK